MGRQPLWWAALCAALLSGALPRPQPGRLAPGLRVAQVPVGGLDRAACARTLQRATAAAAVTFVVGPHRVRASWDDLGLALDEEATWRAAYAPGHQADRSQAEWQWLCAGVQAFRSEPVLTGHWRLTARYLRDLAAATAGPDGVLNVPATLTALQHALRRDLSPVLDCPRRARPDVVLPGGYREAATRCLAAPRNPAQAANWRLALQRLDGLVLRPGLPVCLNDRLFPPGERLPYGWAACRAETGLLGRWGEGCEPAVRAVARMLREAGVPVRVAPLEPRWRSLLPVAARYVAQGAGPRTYLLRATLGPPAPRLTLWAGTPSPGYVTAPAAAALDAALVLAAVGDIQPMGATAPQLPGALREADLRFANLEAPLTRAGEPTPYKSALDLATNREFLFRADPDVALPLLADAVDVVSLANNHALDYGPAANAQTAALLQQCGVASCGAGADREAAAAPVVGELDRGPTVACLAFVCADTLPQARAFAAADRRPGLALLFSTPQGELTAESRALLRGSVRRAAAAAEVVVLSVHWGQEKSRTVLPYQRALAREAVAAGADLILGHHPHRLQAVEMLSGRLVCYSLGNCLFPGAAGAQARSAVVRVALGQQGQLLGAVLAPYRLVRGNPQPVAVDERPVLAAARADLGL